MIGVAARAKQPVGHEQRRMEDTVVKEVILTS